MFRRVWAGVKRATGRGWKSLLRTRTFHGFKWPTDAVAWSRTEHGTDASVVMAPVLTVARTLPESPVTVMEVTDDGDGEQHDNHALARLLRRPNEHTSDANLWLATVIDFLLDGNAYWIVVRDGTGRPAELWWAPQWLVEPVRDPASGNLVDWYTYSPVAGNQVRLDPADVIHFRYGFDAANTAKGMSPLASVLREVMSDQEAGELTVSMMGNMGVPGLIVSPDTDQAIPPGDAEATKAYLEDGFTGKNRGKPLVLRGRTRVSTLGWAPKDMEVRELRRVPEERITAVLGTPAIAVGLGAGLDRSTYANYAEARQALYKQAILPYQRMLAAEVTAQLLPEFEASPDQWRVQFDTSEVRELAVDEAMKAQKWQTLVNAGIARRDEARAAFGLEVGPADEVYLQSFSVLERPASAPPMPPQQQLTAGRKQITRKRAVSRWAGEQLVVAVEKDAQRLSEAMADDLQEAFEALGDEVAQVWERHAPVLSARKDSDAAIVERVMAGVAIGTFTDQRLRPAFEQGYLRTAEATVETLNAVLDLGLDLPDHVARSIVGLGGTRAGLVDVAGETRRAIYSTLAQARADGLGPPAAARLIRDQVPAGRFTYAGSRYRSLMIARTETKYAQNHSTIECSRESPAVVGMRAYDNRIGHDDEDCIERDGQLFTFEEAELETELEHPNGTLSFAPATREDMNE